MFIMERKIASRMEGCSKRKFTKKIGPMPLVASRKGSTAPACPCSPGPFILTTLRCTSAQPKLIELGAHTCPYRTASSLLRNSVIRFSYCTPSSSKSVCPTAATSLLGVLAWAHRSSCIRCLLVTPVTTWSALSLSN